MEARYWCALPLVVVFRLAQAAACDSELAAVLAANRVAYPGPQMSADDIQNVAIGELNTGVSQTKIQSVKSAIQDQKQNLSTGRYEPNQARAVIAHLEYQLCILTNGAEANTKPIQEKATEPRNRQTPTQNTNPQPNSQPPSVQSPSASIEDSKRRALGLQARGDAAAQKKGRRVHSAALEAHDCVSLDRTLGLLYGGFRNSCPYKIVVSYCNFRPKPDTWGQGVNCEKKQGIGATFIGANQGSVDHTNGAEFVYWFACRDPSWPVEAEYTSGHGLMARCRED